MSSCDWEVIEGDEAEDDVDTYQHFICNQCGATTWCPGDMWPIDCMEKE